MKESTQELIETYRYIGGTGDRTLYIWVILITGITFYINAAYELIAGWASGQGAFIEGTITFIAFSAFVWIVFLWFRYLIKKELDKRWSHGDIQAVV